MQVRSRASRTKIILDDGDLTELLAEGKLSGAYKGHRFVLNSPILSAGVDVEEYTKVKEGLATYSNLVDEQTKVNDELRGALKKLKRAYKKVKKETIPIEEHNDLIGAKVKAFDHAAEAIEEESKQAINKLEDEADEMTAEIRDLKGSIGNLENDLQLTKNDLADCEN